jgi:phenylacetyl-CoA:acceptor oxidoreductase subunit 2
MRGAEPQRQTYWTWKAAGNFIGGGTGGGLLFLTGVAAPREAFWLFIAGLVAHGFVAAGLLSVFFQLGRPFRAPRVIFRPQTSWMTRETLSDAVVFSIWLSAIWFGLPSLGRIMGLLALVPLYCHARMLKAAKGIPAWREPAIVPLIFSTGLTEGAAVFIVLAVIFGHTERWAIAALAVLVTARLLIWGVYRSRLVTPGAAPRGTAEFLEKINLGLILVGHVAPLTLLVITHFAPVLGYGPAVGGALLSLLSGWYLKHVLVTRAGYTQGLALPRLPARTPGFGGSAARPGWT